MARDGVVRVSDSIRDLIRMTREESAHLTQRQAGQAAGYSAVWWRHIESGAQEEARVDTLARMCFATGVSPASLRAIGEDEVALEVAKRQALLARDGDTPYHDDAEAHLWRTPVDSGTKRALIAYLRLLREAGGDPAAAVIMRGLRRKGYEEDGHSA